MSNIWGTVETVTDVIFSGSKITTDGDFSHEIEIAPWKKSFDKLDSILESRGRRGRHRMRWLDSIIESMDEFE